MSFLDNLFGGGGDENWGNQQGAFNKFAQQMREQAGRYDPWINTGQSALGTSVGEYQKLIDNPNFLQDMISKGFYMSPYQNQMQDIVTQRMNNNAANTGMLGSGAANRALQSELTALTGQFQNDYINRGMQSYFPGLTGFGQTAQMGLGALNETMPLYEQAAGAELKGAQSAQAAQANRNGSILGGIGGLLGMGASFLPGIGGMLGKGLSGLFGGFGGSGNSSGSTYDMGNSGSNWHWVT